MALEILLSCPWPLTLTPGSEQGRAPVPEPLNRSVTFHIPVLLSPPLAHPDLDNSPSVSLCLLWREPCTSQPSTQAHPKPLSPFLWKLCLCPLLSYLTVCRFFSPSACMTPYFSLISPCLQSLFGFSVHPLSVSNLPSQLSLRYYSPSREINLPVSGRILFLTQDSSVCYCYGVFPSSVFSPVIHRLFIFSAKPSRASANFLPPDSFQIQLNLRRFKLTF